jgi:hypothetical protein
MAAMYVVAVDWDRFDSSQFRYFRIADVDKASGTRGQGVSKSYPE